jgi:hypothetical protein
MIGRNLSKELAEVSFHLRSFFLLALAICSLTAKAQDEYYRNFTALTDTNDPIRAFKPVLVDTNNVGMKVTNAVLNLEKLLQTGEISGLCVGMTMGETVAAWGKPMGGTYRCVHGLPTLFYTGAALAFNGNNLEIMQLPAGPKLSDGLSSFAAPKDFVHVLGPAKRHIEKSGGTYALDYVGPKASIRLYFWDDRLTYIWIVRSEKSLDPSKQSHNPL